MIARLIRANGRPLGLGILSFAVLAGLWQLLSDTGVINPFLVSSPSSVASALGSQANSGILWRNLGVSIEELAVGLGLSIVIGIPVGTAMGWYRRVDYSLDPFVWLGYSAPLIALYPVFIIIFGLGTSTVIVITFLLAVFPLVVNTARGVKDVDPKLLQAARSFCASDPQIFRKIALPSAVPLIMAGLRLAVGRALIGVVIGELFGGNAGLGYSISYYGGLLKTTNMLASVVVIGLLGVVLTQLAGLVERRLQSWRADTMKS